MSWCPPFDRVQSPELAIDARLRRSFDVDDVLQVTFLEAFLRIRSLDCPTGAAFRAWLRRIAEHNLADAVRAKPASSSPDCRRRSRNCRRATGP